MDSTNIRYYNRYILNKMMKSAFSNLFDCLQFFKPLNQRIFGFRPQDLFYHTPINIEMGPLQVSSFLLWQPTGILYFKVKRITCVPPHQMRHKSQTKKLRVWHNVIEDNSSFKMVQEFGFYHN